MRGVLVRGALCESNAVPEPEGVDYPLDLRRALALCRVLLLCMRCNYLITRLCVCVHKYTIVINCMTAMYNYV